MASDDIAAGDTAELQLRNTINPQTKQVSSLLLLDDDDIEQIHEAFLEADVDNSGALGEAELQSMWRSMWPTLPNKDLREMSDNMMEDLDPNKDGFVSWTEFEEFFAKLRDRSAWTPVDYVVHGKYHRHQPTLREAIWFIMEKDNTQYHNCPLHIMMLRKYVFLFSSFILIASIIILVIESDAAPDSKLRGKIVPGEAFCMFIFVVELVVRAIVTPDRKAFWKTVKTAIDIIAIAPFIIGTMDPRGNKPVGENNSRIIQALRYIQLSRLLRLLKLWRIGEQFDTVKVLFISLHNVYKSLAVALLGINSVNIIFFAGIMSLAERDQAVWVEEENLWIRSNESNYTDAGAEIMFQSIGPSMWWVIVTLTTVGYGDMYPVTAPGKGVAAVCMAVSIVLMAFPLTLLADSFAKICRELEKKMDAKKRSQVFSAHILAGKEGARAIAEGSEGRMDAPMDSGMDEGGDTPGQAKGSGMGGWLSKGKSFKKGRNEINNTNTIECGAFGNIDIPIKKAAPVRSSWFTKPPPARTPVALSGSAGSPQAPSPEKPAEKPASPEHSASPTSARGGGGAGSDGDDGGADDDGGRAAADGGPADGAAAAAVRPGGFFDGLTKKQRVSVPNPLVAGGQLARMSIDSAQPLVPGTIELEGMVAGRPGAARIVEELSELKQLLGRQEQILVRRGGVQVQELELLQMLASRMSRQEDFIREMAGRMERTEELMREVHQHVLRHVFSGAVMVAPGDAASAPPPRRHSEFWESAGPGSQPPDPTAVMHGGLQMQPMPQPMAPQPQLHPQQQVFRRSSGPW